MNTWDFPSNLRIFGDILVIGAPGTGYESLYTKFDSNKAGQAKARLLGDCGFRASALYPHQWIIDTNKLFYEMTVPNKRLTVWFGTADNVEALMFLPWSRIIFLFPTPEEYLRRVNDYRTSAPIQAEPSKEVSASLLRHEDRLRQLSESKWLSKNTIVTTFTDESIEVINSLIYKFCSNTKPSYVYSKTLIASNLLAEDAFASTFKFSSYVNPETKERREVWSVFDCHMVYKIFPDGSTTLKFAKTSLEDMSAAWNTKLEFTTDETDERATRNFLAMLDDLNLGMTLLSSFYKYSGERRANVYTKASGVKVYEILDKANSLGALLNGEKDVLWRVKVNDDDSASPFSFKMTTNSVNSNAWNAMKFAAKDATTKTLVWDSNNSKQKLDRDVFELRSTMDKALRYGDRFRGLITADVLGLTQNGKM